MSVPARHAHAKVGLLGGSFNPAHDGHRAISLFALERLGLDAVWWLVTPGNPLKDEGDYAPYADRMAGARRLAAHPAIVISNFEERRGLRYTVDTLEALAELWPQIRFVWLMGADSFAGAHRWKDWRKLFTLAPVAVFNRPGFEEAALGGEAARAFAAFRRDESEARELCEEEPPAWIYFPQTANALSSTALRAAKGEKP